MKAVFFAWEKYHARTELLARAVGAQVLYQYRLGRVKGPPLLLKYALQAWDLVGLLGRERPDAVVVQTPPVFPAIIAGVSIYGLVADPQTVRDQINQLADATGELPAVNQIEWSPFGWSSEMLDFCQEQGIVIQAYSPLTRAERTGYTETSRHADVVEPAVVVVSSMRSHPPGPV